MVKKKIEEGLRKLINNRINRTEYFDTFVVSRCTFDEAIHFKLCRVTFLPCNLLVFRYESSERNGRDFVRSAQRYCGLAKLFPSCFEDNVGQGNRAIERYREWI